MGFQAVGQLNGLAERSGERRQHTLEVLCAERQESGAIATDAGITSGGVRMSACVGLM